MIRRKFLLVGISLLLIFYAGCSKPKTSTDRIGVVVSIIPMAEFAEKIGGDKVEVSVMIPPGASPHTYEPVPNQLVKVSKAKVYVKVGSPVEFEVIWLDKILSANQNMLVVDASAGIKLVEMKNKHERRGDHESGRYDPHIWLSPKNAKIMLENIYKGLISIDPINEKYYRANKEAYLEELNTLDREIEQILSGKTNRRFMVYHPAWGYFARDYNLEQIPVEEEGKEPTAQGIKHLIDQAKEHNIKVVFASPQFSTASAKIIAREIGGRIVLISSLEKDYVANIRKITQVLSEVIE